MRHNSHVFAVSLVAVVVIALLTIVMTPRVNPGAIEASALIINPAGGVLTNGSDGIRLEFNRSVNNGRIGRPRDDKGDGVFWRKKSYFWNGGDSGFVLTVGGGSGNAIQSIVDSQDSNNFGNVLFDTIEIGNLTGSAIKCNSTTMVNATTTVVNATVGPANAQTNCSGSTTGSGSGVITYSKTLGGLVYKVVRSISYTYPEQSYLDQYTVIIPTGNTAVVKLYKGGDTTPGGANNGRGVYFAAPVRAVLSIETSENVLIGMKEVSRLTNMSTFEGAVEFDILELNTSLNPKVYGYVNANKNVGYDSGPSKNSSDRHNVAFMIQYNIGDDPSTPDPEVAAAGTYHEESIVWVADQGVSVDASWQSQSVLKDGQLDLSLSNTFETNVTGQGFRFTVPSPLYVTDFDDYCGGTTTVTNSTIVDVSGVTLDSFTNCVISLKVGRPTAGVTTYTSSSVSNMTAGMKNLIGTSSITFTQQSNTPTPSDTPSPTLTTTWTPSLTPSLTLTYTQTYTPSMTPTRTPSFTRSQTPTRSNTLTRTPSYTRTSSRTRTPSPTYTFTATPTATYTASMTASRSATPTATATETAVFTPSNTRTASKTRTVSPSNTLSPTLTVTPTMRSDHVVRVAMGHGYILGMLGNGSLVTWGKNTVGQVTIPATLRTTLFIDVGASVDTSFAIDGEHRLYAWGGNEYGERNIPLAAQTNVQAVDGGSRHVLALKTDGTVVAWGRNQYGQARVPTGLRDVIAVAAGDEFSLALTSAGQVVAWGRNQYDQARVPTGLSDVIAIVAGSDHAVALRFDGTVVAWGNNSKGQISGMKYAKDVIQIGAGREYSVLLRADGSLYAYGSNYVNAINFPRLITNVVWISASWVHTVIGLRDGTIRIFGSMVDDEIYTSPSPTASPLITETASATSTPSVTLTPSRTLTASPTFLPTRTPTFKR
jgi:hypothetical protein